MSWFGGALAVLLLAGCGGGGGSAAPAAPPPSSPPSSADVIISGTVTYDFVPATVFGLDYVSVEARPVRLATVQFIEGSPPDSSPVLAAAQTDENGDYSLTVPGNRTGFVRVLAESVQTGTPGWNFQVRDNTAGDVLFALDGTESSSGTANSVRDLHAASGWTGSAYGEPRAAAPFAILDSIQTGAAYVLATESIVLPALDIFWSELNSIELDDGTVNVDEGALGSSFYRGDGIYLLGMEDEDTEEYDRHVIVHEFGHYLENQLGRSDSIGGPHAPGDFLDLRVAFSEGWATAFAALALDDPQYVDTGLDEQSASFSFNVEAPRLGPPYFDTLNPAPGWYSEESVWELIYDIVDTGPDGGDDNLSLPFANVWDAMTDDVATTSAVTSIFPFLAGIKADLDSGNAAMVDGLTEDQSIDAVAGDFADGESNNAGSADVLPIYTELAIGATENVCSTDEFSSGFTGSINKLSSRRYLTFTPSAGTTTITVRATDIPADQYSDPDFILHQQGPLTISEQSPTAACQNVASGSGNVGDCVESATYNLPAELYVLEVYEWTNTLDQGSSTGFEPIGRTCFDVTVTQP